METAVIKEIGFDVEKIRMDFPTLQLKINGQPLIYFDNGATSQKPQQVIDAISNYYIHSNANVHRALHTLAERATAGYENGRKNIASFINAGSEKEIIFTRGTTEGINLVAHSWAGKFMNDGDNLIVTEMEHHSNIVPWQLLATRKKINVNFAPVTENGELDLQALKALVTPKTKLIALTHMSNVLGTITPVKEIVQYAHSKNVKVLIDAAQSVPNIKIDVQNLGCDFLSFSSHKMLGPTGIGVLYIKEEIQRQMEPFMGGGEMIATVGKEGSTWADIPHKFEPGTPNIAGVFGLSAAVNYLRSIGMDNITTYKNRLTHYAIDNLKRVKGLTIFGNAAHRGSAISFEIKNVHPFDLAQYLDQAGIAIRSGHHCAQPLMKKLAVTGTSRASLYFYNTFQEVDIFTEKLEKAIHFFK